MNSIFSLPHIFIVFNPGSGGNFLAGIFNRLLNSNLQSITVAKDGSSHTLVNNKVTGSDFLSFGTLVEEQEPFNSEEEREQFYLTKIKEHYSNVTEPQIVWTHDFTNIPLYRKHFKNSKIFVITNNSDQEQITTIIMNISKTILGNAAIPLSKDMWEYALERWRRGCIQELSKLVGVDSAKEILADRLNPDNKEILEYVSIKTFLWYYKMLELIEPNAKKEQRVFNNVLYPTRNFQVLYKVGKTLESYIDSECIVLPYSYLADNDINLLCEKIEELFSKNLTDDERVYISEQFNKYRDTQNQIMLTNPYKYYHNLEKNIQEKFT